MNKSAKGIGGDGVNITGGETKGGITALANTNLVSGTSTIGTLVDSIDVGPSGTITVIGMGVGMTCFINLLIISLSIIGTLADLM